MKYKEWVSEISRWVKKTGGELVHPYEVAHLIDEVSPWLSKKWISISGDFLAPHRLGMGLKVRQRSHTQIELVLPARWKNRSQSGRVHPGAMVTLAQECLEIFWSGHVNPINTQMEIGEFNGRFFQPVFGEVRARFHIKESELEENLFELKKNRFVQLLNEVEIFSSQDQLLALVSCKILLQKQGALPPSSSSEQS